jgi:DNA-binding IclR family transcriptional regulator
LAQLGLSKAQLRKRVKALEGEAEQIRKRRVAEADPISYASGVTLSGFAAIAAPIFDASQRLRFAITLIYRTDRNSRRKDELLRLTLQAANRASHLAGGATTG